MDADNKYGSGFYKCLSNDLKEELPGVDGLSPSNLRYTKRFYLLYNELVGNFQQLAENSDDTNLQQLAENLFSVPWGHHLFLIDKCSNDPVKAYYYVRQTVENACSRAMLENFYNLNLRCYVVIEVKMGEFDSGDIGQIGTYVTAVNHILCKDGIDNPTIGLLICKSKDSLLAQYALESSSQPIGISEFELSKLYPEKVEGTIPTCEELEQQLMKDKE